MSRRLTTNVLPKVPVQFDYSSSATTCEEVRNEPRSDARQPGSRIYPSCIDDKALVLTKYLPPDSTGCPRFRFYRSREPKAAAQVIVHKNCLIDSYYPIIECDNSEDHDSQKSRFELQNIKESANHGSLTIKYAAHLQSHTKKKSIDSRTFTIYSYKSGSTPYHKIDHPPAEGSVDFQGNCEAFLGPECFSQLHERIEKLEEKLHQTLKKSIQIYDITRKKSVSVQKLLRMISGILERNEKPRVQESYESDNSDTENELRNIRKKLNSLEKRLKKEKRSSARGYLQSTRTNSLFLKGNVNDESSRGSRIILKESDYTEPLHSATDSHFEKKDPFKNKDQPAEEKRKKQVEEKILQKCGVLKRKNNLIGKTFMAPSEYQNTKNECVDKEVHGCGTEHLPVAQISRTRSKPYHTKKVESEWKRKYRKKKRTKNRKLCKKNSKINIVTGESRNVKETSTKNEWVANQNQNCWVPCACAGCPYRDLSTSLPFLSDSLAASFRPFREDTETPGLDINPLNFFSYGSNDKKAILFEEIITTPKAMGDSNKASKLKMGSVLIHRKKDTLATLKNFVKKLSQMHATETKINKFLKV